MSIANTKCLVKEHEYSFLILLIGHLVSIFSVQLLNFRVKEMPQSLKVFSIQHQKQLSVEKV